MALRESSSSYKPVLSTDRPYSAPVSKWRVDGEKEKDAFELRKNVRVSHFSKSV